MAIEERKYAAYLCKGCGIGEILNFADLSKVATREAKFGIVKEHDVMCSPEALEMIRQDIANEGVNCVLIAACSPRVKFEEFDFPGCIVERLGLRELVAWTQDPENKETQNLAEDYIRMYGAKIKKTNLPEPFKFEEELSKTILVIGGGAYSGAPALAALGALRAGADIVTVAAPRNVSDIIASFSPNLIVRGLSGDRLVEDDIPVISELIAKHDVVVMGMGLGTSDETFSAVIKIVPLCWKAVIDADALTPELLPLLNRNIIITPHKGEMKRLSGVEVPREQNEKVKFIMDFAKENEVNVLIKGAIDIISDGIEVRANRTGNAGMTVGGTGDVLAGLTGALYAKHDAFPAACAGAFINGAAGDLAFEEFGYGLLATDVIDYIPAVMKA